jgi:predicted secreted protein
MAKIKSFGIRVFVGSEEIGGLKSVDLPETEVTDIDLTTHDTSTGFRVYDGGLKDGGTVTIGGAYDIEDDGQDLLRDPDEQGETYPVAVVFSDGSNATFDAVVKGYGITNPLDENLEFTSSLKISGETNYSQYPPYLEVTGITTPAGSDPLILSRIVE